MGQPESEGGFFICVRCLLKYELIVPVGDDQMCCGWLCLCPVCGELCEIHKVAKNVFL